MSENAQDAEYWNERARHYDGLKWVHNQDLLQFTVTRFRQSIDDDLPGPRSMAPRVLEIGCGTGAFTEAFLQVLPVRGSLVATDISQEMLDAAERRLRPGRPDRIPPLIAIPSDHALCRGESHYLGEFDAVVSRMVLHHTDDPGQAIQRWASLLPPGGGLVAIAEGPPPVEDLYHPAAVLYSKAMELKEPGRHVFGLRHMTDWLYAAGAQVVHVHETHSEGNSLLGWLDGSNVQGQLRERIVRLHKAAFVENGGAAALAYQMQALPNGDVTMRWRHALVIGVFR